MMSVRLITGVPVQGRLDGVVAESIFIDVFGPQSFQNGHIVPKRRVVPGRNDSRTCRLFQQIFDPLLITKVHDGWRVVPVLLQLERLVVYPKPSQSGGKSEHHVNGNGRQQHLWRLSRKRC
jgi:hypothetical protein